MILSVRINNAMATEKGVDRLNDAIQIQDHLIPH